MSVTRTLTAAACLALLAGCGSSPASSADKAASFEEALGLDQASINAREAKVQEAIRVCMKTQGFDYVPIDTSQGNFKVSIGGIGEGSDDPKFRRTKGYGITTMLGQRRRPAGSGPKDPNATIRNGLSDADKEAYDEALYGANRPQRVEGPNGGGMIMRREAGGTSSSTDAGPTDEGCFGTSQKSVPGGPATLGDSLQELDDRIQNDPRMIQAQRDWVSCIAEAGYDQFQEPDDIPEYLMSELQKISGGPSSSDADGGTSFAIGGDDIDPTKLAALQREELALAKLDDGCKKKTGAEKVAKQVQKDAQQRFLDDHPDLVVGS